MYCYLHFYHLQNSVDLDNEELKAYEKFLSKLREISAIDEIYDNISDVKLDK